MTRGGSDRATLIGQVASVRGGVVRVKLDDLPTTLVMVGGQSYRLGQIGAFLRIPLGYTQLYGVCTQVGADAAPPRSDPTEIEIVHSNDTLELSGYRWLTLALFGEAVGGEFDRGVGMYPTVGDSVHLVTPQDLGVIYRDQVPGNAITVGRIAGAAGLPARLEVSALVSRHSCIVGSTGSGKSNLVAIILDALTSEEFPSARLLVVDPHGEYASAVGSKAHVITTGPATASDPRRLRVPYWALPFDELIDMTMGKMQDSQLESLRERMRDMKEHASRLMAVPPPEGTVTADSPIPFSMKKLWFELEDRERATYDESNKQDDTTLCSRESDGDMDRLIPPKYPAPTSTNTKPYPNRQRWGIRRQLDLLRSRMTDSRYAFMFADDDDLHPNLNGEVVKDLSDVLGEWIGGPEPVTVLDVSGLPPEVLSTVVGTMLEIVYGALYWAMELPVGGRQQPLLIILDEAHRFLPLGKDSVTHRTVSRIAKEGRKYGVGLMVVTQRPSDVDGSVLSQCGTMLALRVSNPSDRSAVAASIPDDLGGLTELLPSLRTGEALVLGDALQVPSRIRVQKARRKPIGEDPVLPEAWQRTPRPDVGHYAEAVRNWRAQSTTGFEQSDKENT
jgi:hypothetical protein